MAASREGDDGGVQQILQEGQSLRVAWHEENDNLLLYTCRFQFSEAIALTPIANCADVSGEFERYSLLHYCVQADWVAAGKAMVERGATSQGRVSFTEWLLAHCFLTG